MKQIFCVCLILLISTLAFAQTDGSGVTPSKKTTPKKTTVTTPTKKKPNVTKTSPKTTIKSKQKTKTTPAKIIYATLSLAVNEPSSEIFLSNDEGNIFEGQDSAVTNENGVLEINDVPAGNYTLTVRKIGFFDEERKISVVGGRVNSVSITLRASTAFLSVATNVEGTNIEIENVGEYENGVENLLLNPGTYRVSVYKNGYLSETKSVSLSSAGQRGQVSFDLKTLPVQEFLSSAESDLRGGNWSGALRTAKKILVVQPENAKANLLAGLAYFQSPNPSDGVLLLSRAISYGERVSIPVRIFNKEKNDLQLIAGNLIFGKNSLEFVSANRPELNFLTSQAQFGELFEKFDEFGLKHISIKARGDFNGKSDRRTVRVYSQQTAVKASRKELMCPNCTANSCPCQAEETALYDLLNRWRNAAFLLFEPNFGAVIFPSDNFELFQTTKFSVKLPENWQILVKNERQVFAAPNGGYYKAPNTTNYLYSHGVEVVIFDNPNQIDLNQATKNFTETVLLRSNSYLQPDKVSNIKLSFGNVRVSTFKGLSPISKRQEIITVYTAITPNGDILLVTNVITPDESADYEPAFRRILNSITFR